MTYREAERLVVPYISDNITNEELEEFLNRIEHYENYREELEIYFAVDVGIRQLDEGTDSYNIQEALGTVLELSHQRIRISELPQATRCAVNTLRFWTLLMALMLQFRLWGQSGFLGL